MRLWGHESWELSPNALHDNDDIDHIFNLCELFLIDWHEGLRRECESLFDEMGHIHTFIFSVLFNNDFQLLKCDRKEVQDCHAALVFCIFFFSNLWYSIQAVELVTSFTNSEQCSWTHEGFVYSKLILR